MKNTLLILMLLYGSLAFGANLTISVVPAGLTLYPDARKAIGHIIATINCGGIRRSTSISTSLLRGPHMQSDTEISKFLKRYQSSVKVFSYSINQKNCDELVAFDDFHHDLNGISFSAILDPLNEYEKFHKGIPSKPGGTGASYAVALLKLAGIKISFESCKEKLLGKKFETPKSVLRCLSKSSGERTL